MITQIATAKIKKGTIALPEKFRKFWKWEDILIKAYENKIIIERLKPKEKIFDNKTKKKLQAVGKKITNKNIKEAIIWARKKEK